MIRGNHVQILMTITYSNTNDFKVYGIQLEIGILSLRKHAHKLFSFGGLISFIVHCFIVISSLELYLNFSTNLPRIKKSHKLFQGSKRIYLGYLI